MAILLSLPQNVAEGDFFQASEQRMPVEFALA